MISSFSVKMRCLDITENRNIHLLTQTFVSRQNKIIWDGTKQFSWWEKAHHTVENHGMNLIFTEPSRQRLFPIIEFSPAQPYSTQVSNLDKTAFANSKVFSLTALHRPSCLHLLFPSVLVLWTSSDRNPRDCRTWMGHRRFWTASLRDLLLKEGLALPHSSPSPTLLCPTEGWFLLLSFSLH